MEGGSQAQDNGQAIYAKIRYSVSSTFATGCSLIVGSKFIVFALFYFVYDGNFLSTSPRGAYIWRGDLTEGFLRYDFGGLLFGGAYTWRGLFSEFYGIFTCENITVAMAS